MYLRLIIAKKSFFFVKLEIIDTHFIKSQTSNKNLNVVNNHNKFKLSLRLFFIIGSIESAENVLLYLYLIISSGASYPKFFNNYFSLSLWFCNASSIIFGFFFSSLWNLLMIYALVLSDNKCSMELKSVPKRTKPLYNIHRSC